MNQAAPAELTQVRDGASCRQWLASLESREGHRLAVIDELWASLRNVNHPPDLVFEILEQARPDHLRDVDQSLRDVLTATFPMPLPKWQQLDRVMNSLRAARDLYKKTYVRLVEDSGVSTHVVIPGAAKSLRTVMPLVRALDYQTRMIRTRIFARARVEGPQWAEACTLALHVRASTFLDAPLHDEVPLLRSVNARALFVYPLLLVAARIETRTEHEAALIDRLARHYAGKVGFRIDEDGKLHENRHGPTLVLTEQYSVRLDSHRLLNRLEARRGLLEDPAGLNEVRLPRGLTIDRTRRLLDDLRVSWSEGYRPLRLNPPPQSGVVLRFGVPAVRSAQPEPSKSAGPSGVASMSYVYGRYEHNTIMRMALGAQNAPRDPVADLMTDGDGATWRGVSGDIAYCERNAASSLGLGMLVALMTSPHDARSATQPRHLRLGRLVSMQQSGDAATGSPRMQLLGIHLWHGTAQLVGIRAADDAFYDDAYYMEGEGRNDPPSVLVLPGKWRMGGSAMMREPMRDVRIHFEHLLDKGVGYERVKIRVSDH